MNVHSSAQCSKHTRVVLLTHLDCVHVSGLHSVMELDGTLLVSQLADKVHKNKNINLPVQKSLPAYSR